MTARIYRPAPSATQSGPGPEKPWRLVFEPESAREIDPLMGWTGSSDMRAQIKLRFSTKEEAIRYAERNSLAYTVDESGASATARRTASYSDNFKPTRVGQWTH